MLSKLLSDTKYPGHNGRVKKLTKINKKIIWHIVYYKKLAEWIRIEIILFSSNEVFY